MTVKPLFTLARSFNGSAIGGHEGAGGALLLSKPHLWDLRSERWQTPRSSKLTHKRHSMSLLGQRVCERKNAERRGEAESLGVLDVHDERELGRLLHRQIGEKFLTSEAGGALQGCVEFFRQ